ncbi:unnamed protein product [Chondrus crispus]|uniref:Tc1-like transposase DDE domain-containing protein n=1 Tax=Chondrus crispus TaxID=2769 RepID=R7Q3T9_CHOCR|nr:unnamed protein product [Chondrus crispus]CDF33202.1 unnamed protein product [Chondrus crispus]|eukprot:XP_005713005.1 unnamed protein product [Chondrus crispus]
MVSAPMMLLRHLVARENFASEKLTWCPADWYKVIWSDEKKFNLDGPDGFAFYWHDLRKDKRIFSRRQGGGNSVMFWGAFCGTKKCELVLLEGNQNAEDYIQTLESYLLPFIDQELNAGWIYMHDGAFIHRAHRVRQFFEEEEVPVMDWPAKSPDLNPIENLWGLLARAVYAGCRQFDNVEELKEAVWEAWDNITTDILKSLLGSMQRRCTDCYLAKGGATKY